MKEMSSGTIGIIGGADGPTSIYIGGKKKRIPLKSRIRNKIYQLKRKRAEKKITAGARTLEEVVSYAVEKYGAVETEIPWKMYELKKDMDFYIYEINMEQGRMEVEVNYDKNVFGISYSGSKKVIKQMKEIAKDLYLYYGVSEDDIRNKSERYHALLAILSI